MLNNLKVGTKLAVGFAVTLILLAVVAAVGTMRLSALSDDLNLIINDRNPKTAQANDIVDSLNLTARAMRNMLLIKSPEEVAREAERIVEARKIIGDRLEKLDATISTPKGKELLKAMKDARAAYVPAQEKFIELAKAGKYDEAIDFMLGTVRKQQNEYLKAVNDMITFLTHQTAEDGKAATAAAETAQQLMIGLAVLAVLLSILMAFIVTRSITRPIGEVVGAARKMSEGNFDFKLESTTKDEVGEVVRAVASVRQSILAMVADANLLAKAAVEGKLSTRADASKHKGEYRTIVDGVNQTLDAVINPLNVAAGYVDRIAKGDIPPKITDSYNGDFNTIKNNLNTCIDALNTLIAQMNRMSAEHDAGDIDVRIEESHFQGAYQTMAKGVNGMVFGHIAVKKKAMACVKEFGEGNMDAPLEAFPGKKRFINDTIEQVRRNIKALIADANMLSEAAVAGKLATRADATQHQGDFRRIVEGVNHTLDAVIGPLNVAANYVDRISKGHIPAKITDSYNGDFNTLKNNLNTCIEAVNKLVADANLLSAAAVAGKLDTRADASQHQGDFRKIVQGVNDTLDAVVSPIQDVQRVMGAMERGDMTQSISAAYQGDFATLKEAINNTIARLSETIAQIITAADALSNASGQVSATAQSLSQASSEQAASVE